MRLLSFKSLMTMSQEVIMSDEKKILTYKGHPLMRLGNMIYYGSMADSHIVMLQVLETKKVGDTDITTHSELIDIIGSTTPDDVVTLTVYRNGSYITIDVTIGEKITETMAQPAVQSSAEQSPFGGSGFPRSFFNR